MQIAPKIPPNSSPTAPYSLQAIDTVLYFTADVLSATDYYPFGMQMAGRSLEGVGYRFGFGGYEKDNKISGIGCIYTTEWRMYASRLGKWFSPDPKENHPALVGWSPFQFAFNNPVYYIDKDGDIPWPNLLVGKTFTTPTSPFGNRMHPIHKTIRFHSGIDLSAPQGTGIRSAARGSVIYAGNLNDGYGNQIVINHGNGYFTRYAHIRDGGIKVKEGDDVRNGQVIGEVGSTGKSTGNHLHFEIRKSNMWGTTIDPTSIFDLDVFLHGKYSRLSDDQILSREAWCNMRIEHIDRRFKKGKITEEFYNFQKNRLAQKLDEVRNEISARGISTQNENQQDIPDQQTETEDN